MSVPWSKETLPDCAQVKLLVPMRPVYVDGPAGGSPVAQPNSTVFGWLYEEAGKPQSGQALALASWCSVNPLYFREMSNPL